MTDDPVERMVRYRLEQAEEALSDAKILAANNAGRNSIVNRAYYAMFYAVMALAERKRFASSKHKGTLAFFDKEFVMTGIFLKELSKSLHKAYDLRLKADYRPVVRVDDETVKSVMADAESFVREISLYLTGAS
ncbi:MAG: HEPN domain-containing protein [bacterium]